MFIQNLHLSHGLNSEVCFGFTAAHPWVQIEGVAPDKPLDSVLSRLMQFSAMDKLKKMALRVIM